MEAFSALDSVEFYDAKAAWERLAADPSDTQAAETLREWSRPFFGPAAEGRHYFVALDTEGRFAPAFGAGGATKPEGEAYVAWWYGLLQELRQEAAAEELDEAAAGHMTTNVARHRLRQHESRHPLRLVEVIACHVDHGVRTEEDSRAWAQQYL